MHASAHETVTSFTPLETVVATNAINGRLSPPSTAHWSLLGSPYLVPMKPGDQAAVSTCCITSPLLPCTMLLASPRLAILRCIFVARQERHRPHRRSSATIPGSMLTRTRKQQHRCARSPPVSIRIPHHGSAITTINSCSCTTTRKQSTSGRLFHQPGTLQDRTTTGTMTSSCITPTPKPATVVRRSRRLRPSRRSSPPSKL
jgi:hypothetical protein